ncbi:MAG TPA: DUF6600 domain-containing protein [Blastocatellia bacterium]|jgi:hypothetical protein|nr:DUF6600 domain-containing protein [Blastocatellia bacterium]
MPKQFIKHFSKIPPQVAIVAVLVAVMGAAGAALLLTKSEPKVEALTAPRAARIERVDGNVGLAHSLNNAQPDWTEAALNTPLTVGDRIYADDDSHAAVAFTGRNYARLNPGASLDVLSLSDRRTQLALRDGSAIFDIGDLGDDELFEIATPNGAVDFNEPGLYQVGIDDSGNSIVSVLSGLAQVVGLAGTGQISKGEVLTLAGQAAAQILLSKIAPDLAGNIVDDYYDYRYPNTYDGRYSDYDAYLEDPYYYDPYRESAGYRYLSQDIPGVYDLDRYGDWTNVDGYGQCWSPRVSAGWSPYRDGYWDLNDTWGPTWVSQEAWGYAPYHYGRWAYANNQRWVWVPTDAIRQPVYAPALVAFIPLQQTNQIAWVPLAPGEQYLPRYYDAGYQPQYLAPAEVVTQVISVRQNYANVNYPAAVTVIPEQYFTREIDSRTVAMANQQLIAQAQPMLDPYAIDNLRQVALRDKDARRRVKVPSDVQQEVFNTPVITSVQPVVPQVRPDVYQALQTEQVTDKQRKKKLKFDDSGQVVAARRWDGLPQTSVPQSSASPVAQEREQRMAALASQAAQGDKAARQEMRQLKREQRREGRTAREQVIAGQPAAQPGAERQDMTREQRKEQKRAERAQREAALQQQQAPAQAQAAQTREQRKEQKRLERQQREAGLQQQVAAQQQNSQRQNEQRKLMKQQARAQSAQQEAAGQQAQVNQQREQVKAQRRAERQQREAVEQQQRQAVMRQAPQQGQFNQEREARKAQRRAERQQREQQVMNQQRAVGQQQNEQRKQMIIIQQADRDRQQRKMERRAAREQAQQPQAAPQPQAQRAPAYAGPPVQQNQADKAQRRAEREQRKAERRKP